MKAAQCTHALVSNVKYYERNFILIGNRLAVPQSREQHVYALFMSPPTKHTPVQTRCEAALQTLLQASLLGGPLF